mmetsp:Transcript_60261/g.120731  ORF Transcript_60261/g.120731 Transcript_60261/m.120731 type:complete len:119 (+) Transcript_60261:255-611(+)
MAISPNRRPEFCAQVTNNGEEELRLFVPKKVMDSCSGKNCRQDVDKSLLYSFVGDASYARYYVLSVDRQPKGLTCCGMVYVSPFDNALAWLAGVAGLASLVWGAFTIAPQQRPKVITE